MKFHLDEGETFKELFTLREGVKVSYIKQERALIDKKEKLFKAKDVTKWGATDTVELLRIKDEILSNKDRAFV